MPKVLLCSLIILPLCIQQATVETLTYLFLYPRMNQINKLDSILLGWNYLLFSHEAKARSLIPPLRIKNSTGFKRC